MGRARLSKSLIQFSVDGWSCALSLLITWGQTMVVVMKIMVTSFKRERNSDPTRDCLRPACECPGVSSRGMGRWWPAAGLGALSVAVHAWDLLKEENN